MAAPALVPVLAPAPSPVEITADQIAVIRETICKDATDAEMQLFFYDCRRRGVHPLDKLIHFTKRNGKYTPVTSIDFLRSRAGDTGDHVGTDDAVFAYATDSTVPVKATVTVYRFVQGQRCAFPASAWMREYRPDADFMWKRMPHVMVAKCAEALALRKAFPQQLGGLYVVEEMAQADDGPAPAAPRRAKDDDARISDAQRTRLFAIAKAAGWTKEDVAIWLKDSRQLESSKDIRRSQYDAICTELEQAPASPEAK